MHGLKKSKNLKVSSRRWLERNLRDPYVKRSRMEGYRSRAAYKLIEIDEKHRILGPNLQVVDLGCSPGSWSQVIVARTGSSLEAPGVIGIDLIEMKPLNGVSFLQYDFLDEETPKKLMEILGGKNPDLLLSDMAAPTTGHRYTDHLRTIHLCEAAADFAMNVLKPGGCFLVKTFQGGAGSQFLANLKQKFQSLHHIKPLSSRAQSPELYLLAKNFYGREK